MAITYGMDFMTAIFEICGGIVATTAGSIGGITSAEVTLPAEIANAVAEVGFWASIPLWLVTLLGSLFITVLSFVMILTVYGRFLRSICIQLWLNGLCPFAGENTTSFGKAF